MELPERRSLEDLRRLAVRVAGEAAAFLRDRFGIEEVLHVVTVHEHDSDEGMRIDVESERNIVELLHAEGFRGIFVGEESGVVKLGNDPLLVVADPLDGSKNYASLIPWSAVSIAIALVENGDARLSSIVAGAIAPVFPWPILSFARGHGAFEGGARVKLQQNDRLVLAYVETPEQARAVHSYLALTGDKRSVRALGSASLEIAWAGMGRAELFVDVRGRLRTVDVAAAVWFAAEAGAKVIVERSDVSLLSIERVGSVVVTASSTAWSRILEALRSSGFTGLASKTPLSTWGKPA
ncbi:inositol monophosphatase family protein [Hyperthermus butylicus]|uniref:Inositol-1-monophosphatase n=1 Tax=Hyperthermus butylicus (strain DSM 5456 / JCM 9403 / PLM1-5) TaxID=415426 RepID=A2BKY6_HYPBU|nr:inositol monophosphatase family protein [Hyperthermus butylicus]ABM80647.1 Inositol-1-monophosphatase [Hyperthermus butylicus DSM 5456]